MPETMSPGYAAAEREAYRSVRRACDAGLDSLALRAELTRRITRLIPTDASYFGTLDRHTGLLRQLLSEGASEEVERQFLEVVYPLADAERTADLVRSGRVVTTESSSDMPGVMGERGFGRELRAAFALGDEPGGMWLALRERRSRAFGEHDVAFIHRIAPHVARALRRAALVDAAKLARLADLDDEDIESRELTPGVVVIDDHWRVTQWTVTAEAHLADLADLSTATSTPTSAIVDLVARQRASGGAAGVSLLSLQGRSGRWYTLRAALAEPDEVGRSSTVMIIAPAVRRPVAPSLTRRYGLSREEREVASLSARGFATGEIADRLGITPSAVREHLAQAEEKIGARGRRAMLAKLFLDRRQPK